MLKHEITYTDFNDVEVTDVFYFNISKPELVDLDVEYKQGFETFLKDIIEARDGQQLVQQFKKIVLLAYGKKSEDGKRFIKSDQLREEFSQSAAYNELYMKLATDHDFAADFIIGIMPKDMGEEVKKKKLAEVESKKEETPTTPQA